jgi:hypothetical protein
MRRLGLLIALSLLTRLVLFTAGFVDADEAVYFVGGDVLLHGGRLYVDFADHKPPFPFLYYALGQLITARNMLGVRLLTALLTLPLTAYAASAFYRHDRRGLVAAVLFLIYGSAFLGHDMLATNCEWLMMLPVAWSLALIADSRSRGATRCAAAGVLVGIGILFKYQAAAWLLPLALAAVWHQPRRTGLRRLTLIFSAASLPLAITWAVFHLQGTAHEFLYWNLTHNVAYALHVPATVAMLARAAAYLAPFLLAVSPLLGAAAHSWRGLQTDDARYQAVLLGTGAAAAFGAALVGGRLYPHYFIPLYLPLALAAAPAVVAWLTPSVIPPGRRFLAATAALWLIFTASDVYLYFARYDVYAETRPVFARVTERLRQDDCFARGPLFVWGGMPMPLFYAETGLTPASRFINVDETLTGCLSTGGSPPDARAVRPDHWDLLMSDLERKPPAYILDAAHSRLGGCTTSIAEFPRLAAFVASGYLPLDTVDGVTIFRQKGCEAR